jgi:predicted HicB family RNase H-like nuclease
MLPHTLSYRGYIPGVERDGIFWGKVLGLSDRISFEGETIQALTDDFHHAIDFYLEDCANTGRAPEPPPSGDLTLHLDPETHGAILAAASAAGKRPDQWPAACDCRRAVRSGSALPSAQAALCWLAPGPAWLRDSPPIGPRIQRSALEIAAMQAIKLSAHIGSDPELRISSHRQRPRHHLVRLSSGCLRRVSAAAAGS